MFDISLNGLEPKGKIMRDIFEELLGEIFATSPLNNEYVVKDGVFKIDLKGAKKENVEVSYVDGNIKVVARKKNIHGQDTKFERTFILNSGYAPETIKASYDDSILTISAEPISKPKGRKIDIE